jgi:RNA polymerase sigma-70 factor (ECF subfamily)
LDDAKLVAAACRGDSAAFEELVRRTGKAVYARVYMEVGRADIAEDLTQETFLKAWREIKTLNSPEGFRGWLMTVAHHVVIDAARRKLRKKRDTGREASGTEVGALADDEMGPPELAEQGEEKNRVLAMLRQLPEEYRQVVAMRYLLGEDYEAIGRQLGVSNGSLRGLLSRGMAMLKDKYLRDERRTP